ncbi:hypothetical protein ABT297_29195 [Dactylosporangium sp. NPDC000555]|uniref:hypothetical protein n=1 Tax=Dactylosporangium sp. NPDC000555 TaxID=3154260 RepID=UPI00332962E9
MTCGASGHDTGGTFLCIRHGGVPSAAFVAALVGGADAGGQRRAPGRTPAEPGEPDVGGPWLPDLPDGALPRWPDARVDEAPGVAGRAAIGPGAGEPDGVAEEIEEIEDRPPAGMRVYTWLFVAVTALHAVLLVVAVLVLRREDEVLRRYAAEPASIDRPSAAAVFELVDRVAGAVTVALWVTLLMFAVWFGIVGRVADRQGRDRRALLRHWTYLGWRLALVPLVVYLFVEAARDETGPADRTAFVAEALTANHTAAVFAWLRIVMLALLTAFVVVVWRRLNPRESAMPPRY